MIKRSKVMVVEYADSKRFPETKASPPEPLVASHEPGNIEHRTSNAEHRRGFPLYPEAPHPAPLLLWGGEGDESAAAAEDRVHGFNARMVSENSLPALRRRGRWIHTFKVTFDHLAIIAAHLSGKKFRDLLYSRGSGLKPALQIISGAGDIAHFAGKSKTLSAEYAPLYRKRQVEDKVTF